MNFDYESVYHDDNSEIIENNEIILDKTTFKDFRIYLKPFSVINQFKLLVNGIEVICPIKPENNQLMFMEKVIDSLKTKSNVFLELPPANNKNIFLLSSSIAFMKYIKDELFKEYKMNCNKLINPKLLFVMKGDNDIEYMIKDIKKLSYKVNTVILKDKKSFCLNNDIEDINIKSQIIKCRKYEDPTSCKYYCNINKIILENYNSFDLKEYKKYGKNKCFCPFYFNIKKAENADVIFINYNYLLKLILKDKLDISFKNSYIIFNDLEFIHEGCTEFSSFNLKINTLGDFIFDLNKLKAFNKSIGTDAEYLSHVIKEDLINKLIKLLKNIAYKIKNEPMFWDWEIIGNDEFKSIFNCNKKEISLKNESFISKLGKYDLLKNNINNDLILNEIDFNLDELSFYIDTIEKIKLNFYNYGFKTKNLKDILNFLYLLDFIHKNNFYNEFNFVLVDNSEVIKSKKKDFKINSKSNNIFSNITNISERVLEIINVNPYVIIQKIINITDYNILVSSENLNPFNLYDSECGIVFKYRFTGESLINTNNVFIGVVSYFSDKLNKEINFDIPSDSESVTSSGSSDTEYDNLFFTIYDLIFMLSDTVPEGIIVYFNSIEILKDFFSFCKNKKLHFKKKVVCDKVSIKGKYIIINEYKKLIRKSKKGAILFSVYNSLDSENFDFKDNDKRMIVILGFKFKDSDNDIIKCKKEYYKDKYSNWEKENVYNLINTYINKVIKHDKDYGGVLLVDNYFIKDENKNFITSWLRNKIKSYNSLNCNFLESDLHKFYSNVNNISKENSKNNIKIKVLDKICEENDC